MGKSADMDKDDAMIVEGHAFMSKFEFIYDGIVGERRAGVDVNPVFCFQV